MSLTDIARGLLGVLMLMAALIICLFLSGRAQPPGRRRQGSEAKRGRGSALQA
jgi:hypothetical protein